MNEQLDPNEDEGVVPRSESIEGRSEDMSNEGEAEEYYMSMKMMTAESQRKKREASSLEYGLNIVNGIIFGVGTMNIIFAVFVLTSGLLKLCDACKPLSTASVALGVFTVVFAITGGFVSRRRGANLLFFYVLMMFFITVSTATLTIVVLVFDAKGYNYGSKWKTLVAKGDGDICDIQERYTCSGWSRCCGHPRNDTQTLQGENVTCEWLEAECESVCPNDYLDSCSSAVQDGLHARLLPFTAVLVSGCVLFCISLFCVVKQKKNPKEAEKSGNYLELEL